MQTLYQVLQRTLLGLLCLLTLSTANAQTSSYPPMYQLPYSGYGTSLADLYARCAAVSTPGNPTTVDAYTSLFGSSGYTTTWYCVSHLTGYNYGSGQIITTCPTGTGYNSSGSPTCSCPASSGTQFYADKQQCISTVQYVPLASTKPINNGSCKTCAGDPVNVGTGNSFQTQTDLMVVTPLSGLTITRTYNSSPVNANAQQKRAFGQRWTQPYDASITQVSTSSGTPSFYVPATCWKRMDTGYTWCDALPSPSPQAVGVLRGDGKSLYFSSSTPGVWTADFGVSAQLSSTVVSGVTTGYTFTDTDNHTETFDGNGLLLTIVAQGGSTEKLTYSDGTTNNSSVARYPSTAPSCSNVQAGAVLPAKTLLCVTDSWGRQLQFEHDNLGRITKTFDPQNQVTLYSYDGASTGCTGSNPTSLACSGSNLTAITYPDGKTKTLFYNEAAQINAGTTCPSSTPVGGGFSYLINALTGIQDENNQRSVSWAYNCAGLITSSQLGGGQDNYQFAVGAPNSSGNSNTVLTTPLSTTITYGFASINGRVVNNSIAQPAGSGSSAATATTSYDVYGNVNSSTDFDGNVTNYTYDTARNLELTRTEAFGTAKVRTISTSWNTAYRLPLQIAEPLRLTTYTYDTAGNLLTKTEQATTDTNGSQGFSATVTGTPSTWTYTYNSIGQVATINGPRTDVTDLTQFTYDSLGNLYTITNAASQVTTLAGYDMNGHVGTITDSNGLVTTYTYAPRGWITSQTVGTEVTNYTYDNAGQLTGVTFPNSATLTYTYDTAHRLTSIVDNAGNSVTYTLDTMGNRTLEQVKDSSNTLKRQISRVIDALNRVKQITGAE